MKEIIINEVKNSLLDAEIQIFTNDNKHYNIIIVSDNFINKEILDRQKIIYDIIGKYIIDKSIHALNLKTYTKNEWMALNS